MQLAVMKQEETKLEHRIVSFQVIAGRTRLASKRRRG